MFSREEFMNHINNIPREEFMEKFRNALDKSHIEYTVGEGKIIWDGLQIPHLDDDYVYSFGEKKPDAHEATVSQERLEEIKARLKGFLK